MRSMLFLIALVSIAGAQPQPQQPVQPAEIDPLALGVLQSSLEPIKQAGNYSFHVRLSEEQMGTNGQMITRVREATETVSHPGRLRIDLQRAEGPVTFLFDRGNVLLYAPTNKLYARLTAPPTIQAALDSLEQQNISFPTSNLLKQDPYASLVDDLTSAYVVGDTVLDGVRVHQLAFTEPGASWQLWVDAGPNPLPRRLEIVYLDRQGQPRVRLDFDKWQLGGNIDPAVFELTLPPDAREIPMLSLREREQ